MEGRRLPGRSVAPAVRDRLLGIIEQRCVTGRNGAVWQIEAVEEAERVRGLNRGDALRDMVLRYCANQRSNVPVHDWPVDGSVLPG